MCCFPPPIVANVTLLVSLEKNEPRCPLVKYGSHNYVAVGHHTPPWPKA